MPEKAKLPDSPEAIEEKMGELQKAEDAVFMKGYPDISMDSLIANGYIVHEAVITQGFKVKMRTLKKKEELEIKSKMSNYDGSQMYVIDEINTDTLAKCVISINGIDLPTDDKKGKNDEVVKTAFVSRKEVITELADALTLAMLEEYRALNKALVILIKGSSKNSLGRLLLGRESA